MKLEEFLSLTINQCIYLNGDKKNICSLFYNSENSKYLIRFHDTLMGHDALYWEDICKDCSLTPPKQKNKYYFWVIKYDGKAETIDLLLDEDGCDTRGELYLEGWHNFRKKKIGDFVWEE